MGDKKLTKLKVRGASETEVKNVLRNEFKESVDYDKCKVRPDGSSLKVDAPGTVDVSKLYERLKKMASSVKIESVVPDDLTEKMNRYKKDLQSIKKQKEDVDSKLVKKEEECKLHQENRKATEVEQQRLRRDKENLNRKIDEKRGKIKEVEEKLKSTERDKEYLNSKLDRKREENMRLEEENKKLQRIIKELEKQKGWTSGGTKVDSFESVDVSHDRVHLRKEVHRQEFHMHQEGNLKLFGNGRGVHQHLRLEFGPRGN